MINKGLEVNAVERSETAFTSKKKILILLIKIRKERLHSWNLLIK
jgi:hypothetical protein